MTTIKLDQLKQDPKNARKHNDRNLASIETSLREVGAARSIVIDESKVILAGNATQKAAIAVGLKQARVIDAAGDELIAVRRSGLTKEQKTRLALQDNRAAELAEGWDVDILREFAAEDVQLDDLWSAEELSALFGEPEIVEGAGGDEFDAAVAEGETRAKRGDVWACGRHRVMCGDSKDFDNINILLGGEKANLLLTDPPYDGSLGGAGFNKSPDIKKRINKMQKSIEHIYSFEPKDIFPVLEKFFMKPASYFFFCNKSLVPRYVNYGLETGRGFDLLAWHKPNFLPMGGQHYYPDTEYIVKLRDKGATFVNGLGRDINYGTYWLMPSLKGDEKEGIEHPTIKPIKILIDCLSVCSTVNDLVLDLFLGSGTTLIAAHRLNRTCYGMEISEKYVDVILRRYEAETGEAPQLLSSSEGAAA